MIDTSAFSTQFSFAEAKRTSLLRFAAWFKRLAIIAKLVYAIVFIYVVFGMGFLFYQLLQAYQSTSNILYLLFTVVLTAMIIYVMYELLFKFGRRTLTLNRFAADNGFEFQPIFSLPRGRFAMFRAGYRQHYRNAVTGTYAGKSFALFDFRFTKGSARYPAAVIYTVLGINTGESFPYARIENKHGEMRGFFGSERPAKISDSNLDQNFKVYSDSSLKLATKTVLSPIFINALLTVSPKADIEIDGTHTYIFMPGTLADEDKIQELFKAVDLIK